MSVTQFFEQELPALLAARGLSLGEGLRVGFVVEGEGAWVIEGTAEGARLLPDDDAPKDCALRCRPEDLPQVLRGGHAATRAWIEGRLVITGDVGLLMRFEGWLRAA
jgi:hypothetical protein